MALLSLPTNYYIVYPIYAQMFGGMENIKFKRPVVPGDQLVTKAHIVKVRGEFGVLHCDGYVAVEEDGLAAVCVSPNPTTGIVNLNLGKGQWHIQVFDITGRKVLEQHSESQATFDISGQPKGLYFLKAQNGFEEVNTKIVLR